MSCCDEWNPRNAIRDSSFGYGSILLLLSTLKFKSYTYHFKRHCIIHWTKRFRWLLICWKDTIFNNPRDMCFPVVDTRDRNFIRLIQLVSWIVMEVSRKLKVISYQKVISAEKSLKISWSLENCFTITIQYIQ